MISRLAGIGNTKSCRCCNITSTSNHGIPLSGLLYSSRTDSKAEENRLHICRLLRHSGELLGRLSLRSCSAKRSSSTTSVIWHRLSTVVQQPCITFHTRSVTQSVSGRLGRKGSVSRLTSMCTASWSWILGHGTWPVKTSTMTKPNPQISVLFVIRLDD